LMGYAIQAMQALSARELAERRASIVAAVRGVASPRVGHGGGGRARDPTAAAGGEAPPPRFVSGGGPGSIERTAAEPAITEVAAGSGLYGPTLFDAYRAFRPAPAAFFVLPVVRKPSPKLATALGGGYIASGAPGRDRLPRPVLPHGLK